MCDCGHGARSAAHARYLTLHGSLSRSVGRVPSRARSSSSKICCEELALLLQHRLDVLAVADDPRERVAVDLVEVAALGADPDREQRLDGIVRLLLLAHGGGLCEQTGRDCLERRPRRQGRTPSGRGSAPAAPIFVMCLISSFAPAGLGAFFGMPSPTRTGMYDRTFGPLGTGNATRSSGRWSSAVFSRAT